MPKVWFEPLTGSIADPSGLKRKSVRPSSTGRASFGSVMVPPPQPWPA